MAIFKGGRLVRTAGMMPNILVMHDISDLSRLLPIRPQKKKNC